jgi:hypothetical protein
MPTIGFVASTSATTSGASTVLAVPGAAQNGDLLVAMFFSGGTSSISGPGGWTQVGSSLSGGASGAALWTHTVTAGDPSSYTFTYDVSAAATGTACLAAYRGVTGVHTPAFAGSTATTSATGTLPSIAASQGDIWLAGCGAWGGAADPAPLTTAAGFVQRANTVNGAAPEMTAWEKLVNVSGATPAPTVGFAASSRWAACSVAVYGAAITFPSVAGYMAWWDAVQISGVTDGAGLSTWRDMSGNGYDMVQSTGSFQPLYYNTTTAKQVNGLPAVWGNGSNSSMQTTLTQAQPYTFVAVAMAVSPGSNQAVMGTSGSFVDLAVAARWRIFAGSSAQFAFAPTANQAFFVAAVVNSSSSNLQQDTTPGGPLNAGTTGLSGTAAMALFGRGVSEPWNGPICEALVYPFALNSTQIASLLSSLGSKWGTPGGGPPPPLTGTASLALGPLTVTSTSTISSPTITGTAVLDIGPLSVVAASVIETRLGAAALLLGPLKLVAIGGNIGPNAWPVPNFRGRWRLTLHNRQFAPAGLMTNIIAELTDARGRQLVQAWNTPATLTFTLDGRSDAAALVEELEHDVVAWRWDDQTGSDIAVFRGVIAQSEDQVSEDQHVVTYTCHDYAAVLQRRLLTATYTVTARDQDLIVGDLLGLASTVHTSSGTALTPASYLPLALAAVTPAGAPRGLSGQNRDRTYYGSQNIGQAVDDLAAVINGFDYDVQPSITDATDSLRVFHPQQGVTRTGIALQYGSTVASLTRSVNSADYANYVRVLGNKTSTAPTPQFYSEAWAAGTASTTAGLWMLADDATDVTVQSTLDEKAAGDLTLDEVLVPHYTLGLRPGAYEWGQPNMGDVVPLIVQTGRLDVNTSVRVLGITYDIGDDGQEDVALVVSRPPPSFKKLFTKSDSDIRALARR